MKFYKSKTPGIFFAHDDDNIRRFVYGTISKLLDAEIIIDDYSLDQYGNRDTEYEEKTWMTVSRDGSTLAFDSKEEAKEYMKAAVDSMYGQYEDLQKRFCYTLAE